MNEESNKEREGEKRRKQFGIKLNAHRSERVNNVK